VIPLTDAAAERLYSLLTVNRVSWVISI